MSIDAPPFARVDLLKWEGRTDEALSKIDSVIELAERTGDDLLRKQVQLTKAELLQTTGRDSSSMALVADGTLGLIGASPELYAYGRTDLSLRLATIDERSARLITLERFECTEASEASRDKRSLQYLGSKRRPGRLAIPQGRPSSRLKGQKHGARA